MGDRKVVAVLVLVFCLVLVTFQTVESVGANMPPFWNIEPNTATVTSWHAPPGAITESTTVIIVSPEANRTYATKDVTLKVNVGTQPIIDDDGGGNSHYIRSIMYKTDWMETAERVFYHLATSSDGKWFLMPKALTLTLNLTGLPEGDHTLTVFVSDSYSKETPSTVNFTVDTKLQQNSIPEYSSWTPLLSTALAAASVVAVVYRSRLAHKRGMIN